MYKFILVILINIIIFKFYSINYINNLQYGSIFKNMELEFKKYRFKFIHLSVTQIRKLCPPPTKNNSNETISELQYLKKITQKKKKKDLFLFKLYDQSANIGFLNFIKNKKLNIDTDKFNDYLHEIELINYQLKYIFNRPRPYQLGRYFNLTIKPYFAYSGNTPAYPSGHAIIGHGAYLYLKELYPQYKKELYNLAKQVENSRVNVGVHYVSDGKASEILINNLYPLIRNRIHH